MESLFLTSELLKAEGVRHGFAIRTGGVSESPFDSLNLGWGVGDDPAAVGENQQRLLGQLGIAADSLATVHQVHGDRVVHAPPETDALSEGPGAPALGGRIEADAIVAAPGRAAGVRTADCVPILLFDRRSGAAAAVHAGWRGTIAYVASHALEAMFQWHGTRPTDVIVAIGPAIGRCCFVVGEDVARQFESKPFFGPGVVDRDREQPRVDLALANARLLAALRVPESQIEVLRECTSCRREVFFSHRRDGGKTGRHLSVIASKR